LGEGRGNAFIEFLKRGRKEIVPNAFGTGNSRKDPGTSEETIPEGQTGATCESLWMKMIGKPYSGKPNVRFDEGELEIEPLATTPALYSTESDTRNNWAEVYSGRINFCYNIAPFKSLKTYYLKIIPSPFQTRSSERILASYQHALPRLQFFCLSKKKFVETCSLSST